MPTENTQRRKILVIDDDHGYVRLVELRFTSLGFEVRSQEDGSDILGVIEREKIELVILDVVLKASVGLEILDIIRGKYQANDLPVIMVSANFEPDGIIAALKRGANDYLSKPFSFAVAAARINTQLSIADLFRDNLRHQQRSAIGALIVTINQEITAPIAAAIFHLQAGILSGDIESMKASELEMMNLAALVRKFRSVLNVDTVTFTEDKAGQVMVKLD